MCKDSGVIYTYSTCLEDHYEKYGLKLNSRERVNLSMSNVKPFLRYTNSLLVTSRADPSLTNEGIRFLKNALIILKDIERNQRVARRLLLKSDLKSAWLIKTIVRKQMRFHRLVLLLTFQHGLIGTPTIDYLMLCYLK